MAKGVVPFNATKLAELRATDKSVLLYFTASALADDQTLTAAVLDRLLHHAHIVQISGEELSAEGQA